MKKICISTYCVSSSYGSMLQALGLQVLLKKMDMFPKTILFQPSENRKKTKPKGVSELIQSFFRVLYKNKLQCSFEKGEQFIQDNICAERYISVQDLKSNPPDADVYIAGSDQIWHPALCREDFFLSYSSKEKKKISYAASMGVLNIPEENRKKFASLLQNIDSVSVREQEMVSVISQFTNHTISVHIDPTFLLTREAWRSFEKPYHIKEPFILLYLIHWDKMYNKHLKELHKQTGYPIVSIQSSFRMFYSNRVLYDVGPAEFLWLIDHAEAVITSSFHGIAFSTIFNKNFSIIKNPNAPSRIDSLLNTLEMTLPEPKNVLDDFSVDYNAVNARIESERQRSIDYLRGEIYEE